MAWTTKKGFNFRDTVAFVTDPAGTLGIPENPGNALQNPPFTGGFNPVTLGGDTFSLGWVPGGDDGARDRSAAVDARLAGKQGGSPTGDLLELQMGTSPGKFKIWIGISDQTNGTGVAPNLTISDANGTLFTLTTGSALTANQVLDAAGNVYATAAAWAATADTTGVGVTVTSTDTSNGRGGPLLKIQQNNGSSPMAHLSVQQLNADGGVNVSTKGPGVQPGKGGTLQFRASPRSSVSNNIATYTMQGGLVFSGADSEIRVEAEPARTGGLVLAGTAAQLRNIAFTMSSGLVFGGTAAKSTFSSQPTVQQPFNQGTGPGVRPFGLNQFQNPPRSSIGGRLFAYTMQGGLVFAGTSVHVSKITRTFSGGLVFSGAASQFNIPVGSNILHHNRRLFPPTFRGH